MHDDETAPQQQSGVDWLLGLRFFLLTFTLAGILGSAVTVSWWARWILDHWQAIRKTIQNAADHVLQDWLHVQLFWDVKQLLPLIVVFSSVIALGLARTRQFSFRGGAEPLVASLIAMGLGLLLQMSFTDVPAEWQEFHNKCRSNPLTSIVNDYWWCAERNPMLGVWGIADYTVFFLFGLCYLGVPYVYPRDFLAATVAACLFLALGMIDLRPFVGPT